MYSRRNDIHAEFGGQQQGGISTPDGAPFIFLFTGEMGEQYGYEDGWAEGVFLYVGEGQRGAMDFVRGNKAIRDHAVNGKELLLFEALRRKGNYRYAGRFDCAGWHMRDAHDADGATRRVIVFELVPSEESSGAANDVGIDSDLSLAVLRVRALETSLSRPLLSPILENPAPPSGGVFFSLIRQELRATRHVVAFRLGETIPPGPALA